MTEFEDSIYDCFEAKKDLKTNKAGVYLLYFYVNGRKTPVIVDDYFPCYNDGKPAFAKGKTDELWVMLLEKGWGKLHGTYARTEGGVPFFASSHLLGTPSDAIEHSDFKEESKLKELH